MKRLVLFITLIIVGFQAFSQYRIGGQIGLNDCNMGYDDKTYYENISQFYGLNIGAVGEYSFMPDLTIRSGLIFSQKGMNSESNTPLYDKGVNIGYAINKYRLKINYIDLPILYHDFAEKARGGGIIKILFNVGPVLSFAVTGKKVISYQEVKNGVVTTADSTQHLIFGLSGNKYSFINFGFHIGTGVEVLDKFTAEIFFNKSFTKAQGTGLWRNSVFGFSLGYMYDFGKGKKR